MSQQSDDVLRDEEKKKYEARGILAYMYRDLLCGMKIDLPRYYDLLNRWIKDPANGIPDDGRTRSTERGNLLKAIFADDMTWNSFLKAIKIHRPKRLIITVALDFGSNRPMPTTQVKLPLRTIDLDVEKD